MWSANEFETLHTQHHANGAKRYRLPIIQSKAATPTAIRMLTPFRIVLKARIGDFCSPQSVCGIQMRGLILKSES